MSFKFYLVFLREAIASYPEAYPIIPIKFPYVCRMYVARYELSKFKYTEQIAVTVLRFSTVKQLVFTSCGVQSKQQIDLEEQPKNELWIY